jgi:hypothetical protein
LAGPNLDGGNPDVLQRSVQRLIKFLPSEHKRAVFDDLCNASA